MSQYVKNIVGIIVVILFTAGTIFTQNISDAMASDSPFLNAQYSCANEMDFEISNSGTCYLFLCTDENGQVVSAACLEDEDGGGLECTGCTPDCNDDDVGSS